MNKPDHELFLGQMVKHGLDIFYCMEQYLDKEVHLFA